MLYILVSANCDNDGNYLNGELDLLSTKLIVYKQKGEMKRRKLHVRAFKQWTVLMKQHFQTYLYNDKFFKIFITHFQKEVKIPNNLHEWMNTYFGFSLFQTHTIH